MNLRSGIRRIWNQHNGLKTVLALFGIHMLFYVEYTMFLDGLLQQLDDGSSMLFVALAILVLEWRTILIGYLALFLKLRIGQVLLALVCGLKAATYILGWFWGNEMDARFFGEMLFYLLMAFSLTFFRGVNSYIKSRKRKIWKEKIAFIKEKLKR